MKQLHEVSQVHYLTRSKYTKTNFTRIWTSKMNRFYRSTYMTSINGINSLKMRRAATKKGCKWKIMHQTCSSQNLQYMQNFHFQKMQCWRKPSGKKSEHKWTISGNLGFDFNRDEKKKPKKHTRQHWKLEFKLKQATRQACKVTQWLSYP